MSWGGGVSVSLSVTSHPSDRVFSVDGRLSVWVGPDPTCREIARPVPKRLESLDETGRFLEVSDTRAEDVGGQYGTSG